MLQLLNEIFSIDRFRSSYLKNRSRRMVVGGNVYIVVSTQQRDNCKKCVYCVMYIRHTWSGKILTDVRKCQKDWHCVFYQDRATSTWFRKLLSYNFETSNIDYLPTIFLLLHLEIMGRCYYSFQINRYLALLARDLAPRGEQFYQPLLTSSFSMTSI